MGVYIGRNSIYSAAFLLPSSLPTHEIFRICSRAIQNCKQYIYFVSLTVHALHNAYREVVLLWFVQQTNTILAATPFRKRGRVLSHYIQLINKLSPKNTIIVPSVLLSCLCEWVANIYKKHISLGNILHGVTVTWWLHFDQTLPHFLKVWLARLTRELGS